jgi:hypothetical protein
MKLREHPKQFSVPSSILNFFFVTASLIVLREKTCSAKEPAFSERTVSGVGFLEEPKLLCVLSTAKIKNFYPFDHIQIEELF